jgi:elongation factor G
MISALQALSEEDPTFRVRSDENTGQTIIWGMGELHLEILVERLLREFRVQAKVGRPQVAYRETITRRVRAEGEFMAPRAGKEIYARVVVELSPLPKGEEFRFQNEASPTAVPAAFVPVIEQSLRESMSGGHLAGYPMVDVGATLIDGTYDEDRAVEGAYHSAAAIAFNKAVQQAHPVLMEPIMKVEVVVPEENTGDAIGDMNTRRGDIEGMEPLPGGMQAIRGHVPLAEMFGYATALRSNTQGRGTFTMEFDYYQAVPREVSERILGGPLYA